MSHSMLPDNEQGVVAEGGVCVCACLDQTGCCVVAVNEMGGYQGKQASLNPV